MNNALVLVPQHDYVAPAHFSRRPPIFFRTNGVPGVRLQDAYNWHLDHLDRANTVVTVSETSNRITLRILVSFRR